MVRYTNAGFNINHIKAETHRIAIMSLDVAKIWNGNTSDDVFKKVC